MELQVFNSTEFGSVRTATVNGEVMFVGKDVADILGYQNGSRDINRHVDEEDRHKVMIFDGNQDKETIIINESGLYSLILSSKMPNAKKFKHWVTSEVLPAIRKHGMYAIDEILENPDLAIAALTQLKEERERRKQLECLALVQRQQIAELQPKASYYDLILQNKNTVPITQIAKDYGMSGRKFNELLHELGVQYKFRKTWLLYQHYAECGYTQSRTYAIDESRSVMHGENIMRSLATKITTAGQHKINIAATKPAAAWIEEGGALSFGDATFDQIYLDAYKLHVAIKVTEELLYDNAFGLENYIITQFGKALANAEEDAFLNGNGTGKPTGIFAANGGGQIAATLTAAIKSDDLIDLVYGLKRP